MKKNKKYKILDELEKIPNVQLACERQGISRQTFYRWIREDIVFSQKVDEALDFAREYVNDIAESHLLSGVKSGVSKDVRFWLNNNSKRYMHNKSNNIVKNNLPLIDIQEAVKVSEKNIIQGVQVGDIKSSKYVLENNDSRYYSSTKARLKMERDSKLTHEISEKDHEEKLKSIERMMMRFADYREEDKEEAKEMEKIKEVEVKKIN